MYVVDEGLLRGMSFWDFRLFQDVCLCKDDIDWFSTVRQKGVNALLFIQFIYFVELNFDCLCPPTLYLKDFCYCAISSRHTTFLTKS